MRVLIQIDKTIITFDRIHMLISGFMSNVSAAAIARIGPVPALDVVPESNPHATRPDTTVFVPDEPTRLPELLPGPETSQESAAQPAVPADPRIYMDEHVPFPTLGQNDAEFLGTPTPRRQVPAQLASLGLGTAPSNTAAHIHMRPGDILSSDPLASPSRASISSHAPSGSGAGHARVVSTSSMNGSFDSPRPAPRPVSVFMEPPSNTTPPYRASRAFPSAEQEKVRLFEQARAEAARFQSQMDSGVTFPEAAPPMDSLANTEYDQAGGVPIHASAPSADRGPATSSHAAAPVSLSEKEQVRRYHEAQDAVARHVQAQEAPTREAAPAAAALQPSPFLTRSEQRAMEEKSQLQSHYAQTSAEASSSAPAPAISDTEASATGPSALVSHPPPRPPKVPLD